MWYLQDLTQEQLQSRFAATPASSIIAAVLGSNSTQASTPVTTCHDEGVSRSCAHSGAEHV